MLYTKYRDNADAGPSHGQEETCTSITSNSWVAMRKDIATYIKVCSICACTKTTNQKPSTPLG